ncbi:MAG: sugar phosphate isomerase/epimerase [Desulfotignum sp.]|jgi:sugar phosphate isomerase/epimerase|nr:sugar phosphate isomerase/epimerase [Desulfotignum sp.]
MKYGAASFPIKPVEDEIRKAGDLGFDFFELSMDPPEGHWTKVRDMEKQIVAALDVFNLSVVCHLPSFVYTPDLSPAIRKASLDEMRHSLDAAAGIGAKKAVLHPGYITGMGVFVMETAKKYAGKSLAAIVAHASRLHIQLCFENMFPGYHIFYNPDEFDSLFAEYPDVKMTLDTGHANIGDPGQEKLKQFVSRFAHRICHVHVSDNFGKKDDHLAVGKGNIDFEGFVSTLKQTGYDDTITLEIFSTDTDDLVKSRERIEFLVSNIGVRS